MDIGEEQEVLLYEEECIAIHTWLDPCIYKSAIKHMCGGGDWIGDQYRWVLSRKHMDWGMVQPLVDATFYCLHMKVRIDTTCGLKAEGLPFAVAGGEVYGPGPGPGAIDADVALLP